MLSTYKLFEDIMPGRNYDISHDSQVKNTNGLFIINFHDALKSGKHFDLRIGKDNVLVSWATKKLPDAVSGDKKIMLFKQPDHNISWYNFSGEIKEGYGKGTVSIWDRGKYDIEKWDGRNIILDFHGSKLSGQYVLVPYNSSDTQFLFFKKK